MTNNEQSPVQTADALTAKITEQRESWFKLITEMASKINKLEAIPDLICEIYSQRQSAIEAYYDILALLAKRKRKYDELYANAYNGIKKGQLEFKSDGAIKAQVESILKDEVYLNTILNNYAEYMQDIVKTLDGMKFSVNNRIELEKIRIS